MVASIPRIRDLSLCSVSSGVSNTVPARETPPRVGTEDAVQGVNAPRVVESFVLAQPKRQPDMNELGIAKLAAAQGLAPQHPLAADLGRRDRAHTAARPSQTATSICGNGLTHRGAAGLSNWR